MSLPQENPSAGRPEIQRAARGLDPRAQQARIAADFSKYRFGKRWLTGSIALIWAMAIGYFMLSPPVYTSKWTLILPASNNGSSVTLDTIGQSSTVPGQTFGSLHLSPKVIYKEIVTSDQVRQAAALSMGIPTPQFSKVRVKLIDETALMMFQIGGGTPELAQAKAQAVNAVFAAQLDALRRDEFEKRATLMRDNLKIYQANLDKARERILDFQRETGLLSLEQFNETSATAELLRRKLTERRSDLEKVLAELRMLTSRVGFDPGAAMAGLRLAADPAFARIAGSYSDAVAVMHENRLRYGPNHPAQLAVRMKLDGSLSEIARIARAAQVDHTVDLTRLVLFMNASAQSELLRGIVSSEATTIGLRNEVAALEGELQKVEVQVTRMGHDTARLEALRKDHLVAEAVFTSATARLDTNRTDLYSSYPLVQVLAEPDLAEVRTQPRLSYAVAAGTFGTFLVLLAWGAAWVRERYRRKRSRSG